MNKIRAVVVAALLAVWCFPAVSSARTSAASEAKPLSPMVAEAPPRGAAAASAGAQATRLAAREQQSRDLQDFKGGAVAIYVSSGALLVAVLVLVVLLI